jgi:hypothetical protein
VVSILVLHETDERVIVGAHLLLGYAIGVPSGARLGVGLFGAISSLEAWLLWRLAMAKIEAY